MKFFHPKQNLLLPMWQRLSNLYIALLMLVGVMMLAIAVYMQMEGYSFIEAFYMTIITMSTVGYEEVKPLSDKGMLFTSFLIIFSLGIFGYAVTTFTRYILDGDFRRHYNMYQETKRMQALKNHVIVCGYGRNGRQAATELLKHNEYVIVIEKKESVVDEQMLANVHFIEMIGDATQEEVLERAGVQRAKALITTLPSDADNLFVVLTSREMNTALTIISRASDDHSDIKLKRAGADNVIMPDKVGGSHMAKLVAEPDVVEFIDSIILRSGKGPEIYIHEVALTNLHPKLIGKTIAHFNIRRNFGASLIGMKTSEGSFIYNPNPEVEIMPHDKLFALGNPDQIAKLKYFLEKNKM